jgi:hypothetical protein
LLFIVLHLLQTTSSSATTTEHHDDSSNHNQQIEQMNVLRASNDELNIRCAGLVNQLSDTLGDLAGLREKFTVMEAGELCL